MTSRDVNVSQCKPCQVGRDEKLDRACGTSRKGEAIPQSALSVKRLKRFAFLRSGKHLCRWVEIMWEAHGARYAASAWTKRSTLPNQQLQTESRCHTFLENTGTQQVCTVDMILATATVRSVDHGGKKDGEITYGGKITGRPTILTNQFYRETLRVRVQEARKKGAMNFSGRFFGCDGQEDKLRVVDDFAVSGGQNFSTVSAGAMV